MTDIKCKVKYGHGVMEFELPKENLLVTLLSRGTTKLSDPICAVRNALNQPIGSKPLKEVVKPGESVVIIVNDITRVVKTDVFLPVIVEELNNCGVLDSNITILVATGLHRGHTSDEYRYIIGDPMFKRLRIVDHVGTDMSSMDYVGTTARGTEVYVNKLVTRSDRVILTGEVTYHQLAGYTGGRKSILPGVASEKTITQNHRFMLEETSRQAHLEDNNAHLDMLEAAKMVGVDFIVNVVLDADRDFVAVFAGDLEQAHASARTLVDNLFAVKIDKLADVVVANCGGYPKDIELYQSQKTLDNAARAVKEGGTIVLLAACEEGLGSTVLLDHFRKFKNPYEIIDYTHAHFKMGEHKAFMLARTLARADVVLISKLQDEIVRDMMMIPAHSVGEALGIVRQKYGKDFSVYFMPEGFLTVPFLTV